MTAPRRFLLDTNVFVQAHRHYYAFDICPGFWAALLEQHERGRILSLDRVKIELDRGKDDLKVWAENTMPKSCFARTDEPGVVGAFAEAQNWANSQPQFQVAAKAQFAQAADGWLPAYAREHQFEVVTLEESSATAQKRVPLPNLCIALGVPYVNTFAMLRELGVSFSWSPR